MTIDLEQRLGSAIRSDLDSAPVDVSGILGATRAAVEADRISEPTPTYPAPDGTTHLTLVELLDGDEDAADPNAVRPHVDRRPPGRGRSLIIAFASAAAVAAVTFGVIALREGSAQSQGDRPATGAAQTSVPTPTGSAASPTTSTPAKSTTESTTQASESPSPTKKSTSSDKEKAIKADVAYLIPTDMIGFTKSDLAGVGTKPEILTSWNDSRLQSVVSGQMCDGGDSEADYQKSLKDAPLWPVAGSTQTWSFANKSDVSIDLVVTGWAEGSIDEHWAELVNDTGPCRFSYQGGTLTPKFEGDAHPDQYWYATFVDKAGYKSGFGASRVGNVIVAVTWSGKSKPPMNAVRKLTELAASRAQTSGLVDTAGGVTGIPSMPNFP